MLVLRVQGGVRPVAGLNGTAPPPVQPFGPPPPLQVVTASVADGEFVGRVRGPWLCWLKGVKAPASCRPNHQPI